MKTLFTRFALSFTSIILAFTCLFHGADRAGSAYQAEEPDKVLMNAVVVSDLHAVDKLNRDNNLVLEKLFAGVAKSETALELMQRS